MTKYRKKPVVVDAVRFVRETPEREVIDILEGCIGWQMCDDDDHGRCIRIPTPEGTMHALDGDWIIKGVAGEVYPCKHEIFESTYESAYELVE